MKKIFTTILTSLCILGTSMVAFAGTDSAQNVPACGCGGIGVYCYTVQVAQWEFDHNHKGDGGPDNCHVVQKGFDEVYRCDKCGAELRDSYTEETHTYN